MSEDSLVGALTGLAAETARLVRHCAEEAVREMSGALGADELRWPRGLLDRTGPVIPKPYKQPGQGASWHDAYMASCEVGGAGRGPAGCLPAGGGLLHARALHVALLSSAFSHTLHPRLPAGAVSVVRSVQQQGLQPVTAAAVLAQAALHFRPGGYRLLQARCGSGRHRCTVLP